MNQGVADAPHRAGYVAIVGRPNVGKSTLLNALVGTKISITSRKAQTTRHRILGVRTDAGVQFVFLDTPGFQNRHRNALNRAMNKSVGEVVGASDVAVLVIEAAGWRDADAAVLALLPAGVPIVLAINKVDAVRDTARLMELGARMGALDRFAAIVPVSARSGKGMDGLLAEIARRLPEAPPMYDADMLTDRPERFLAAEIVREKVFRLAGDEIPYGCEVVIDRFEEEGSLRRILATILVDRQGHKAILLGTGGERMKRIASEARLDMEKLFGGRVYLEVWVKVKSGWADNAAMLKTLGYR
ncbi:MAG: GTPase Era [Burkholderiales bacterium]|nr:GTPase Era [Burkholderiales bacterium]